jgi:hypothetical protein
MTKPTYATRAGLQVSALVDFVESRVLPGLAIGADAFWAGAADILSRLPRATGRCWRGVTLAGPDRRVVQSGRGQEGRP